jgi:hypothetical protein
MEMYRYVNCYAGRQVRIYQLTARQNKSSDWNLNMVHFLASPLHYEAQFEKDTLLCTLFSGGRAWSLASFAAAAVYNEGQAQTTSTHTHTHTHTHTVLCFTQRKCMLRSLALSIIEHWPQDTVRMVAVVNFLEVIEYACCGPGMPCLQFRVMLQWDTVSRGWNKLMRQTRVKSDGRITKYWKSLLGNGRCLCSVS